MDRRDDIGEAIAREISQTIAKKIAIGFALFFGFLFFIAFGGVVVLLLWNWLIPDIFGLRRLMFWEALGLLALVPHPVWRIRQGRPRAPGRTPPRRRSEGMVEVVEAACQRRGSSHVDATARNAMIRGHDS